MKKTENSERNTAGKKYVRDTDISESSRYSRAETFRTGSRYPEKAQGAAGKEKGRARKAVQAASDAAKSAGALALNQAKREQAKVEEARSRGGLKEYETQDIAKAIAAERAKKERTQAESGQEAGIEGVKTGRRGWKRWQSILLAVLAGAAAVSYIVAAVFFAGHFYPGTMIFGINCSAKSVDWTKEQVEERVGAYTLTLQERENRTETIRADQVGMQYEDLGAIEGRMKRQMSAIWPVMMLVRRNETTQIGSAYDPQLIDSALETLGCTRQENQIPPENAYVGEGDEGYVIVPEVMGTTIRMDVLRQTVKDALDQEATDVSLEEHACYTMPSVYADDEELAADAAKRNELLGACITFDFSDRTEVVDTPQIMKFIVRDYDGSYRINTESVWNYVAELAEKYDTYGGTRTFRTSIGTTETLYGGDYGWAIEQNETAQMLLDAIREKKTETVDPIYAYTAMSRNTDDIGDTYVEVCISRQEMWCYKDGELVTDTPVVTGNPNLGNATPSGGVWCIDAKMEKFVLVGEGYRAPVDYWMPFNGNVGIHDLQTRYWFGSTIYLSNGSHGCVNTPLDAVQKIYEAVSVGTPVIVYEGEGISDYGASAWQ